MAPGVLSSTDWSEGGLRPVRYRRDLGQIADLIEVCFAGTLDAGGRAALREMRLMSRSGPLLWQLGRMTTGIPEASGFVWEDAGRLVGNVTVMPAGYGQGCVIANVSVYPDYRRRGIARALMQAALNWAASQSRFAVLQVDADNTAARYLYESLGFQDLRTFTRWRRVTMKPTLEVGAAALPLRPARSQDLPALMALAEQVRPNARGGMGWLRPTQADALRPARWGNLSLLLGGKRVEVWVLPAADGGLAAALRSEKRLGGLTTVLDVLVRPDQQGQLEMALVSDLVRRLDGRFLPLLTDHPADDGAMALALERHAFRPERSLLHMFWSVTTINGMN